MNDEIGKLYSALTKKGYRADEIGDESAFRSAMRNKENRKELYDWISARGDFGIGDYATYETRLTGQDHATTPLKPIEEDTEDKPTMMGMFQMGMAPISMNQAAGATKGLMKDKSDEKYATGLYEGVKQGAESLYQGNKFFAGELANAYSGGSEDAQRALEKLGRGDVGEDKGTPWWKVAGREVVENVPGIGNFAKVVNTVADIADIDIIPEFNEEKRADKIARKALEEAEGDRTRAMQILRDKAVAESWGDRAKREAADALAELKPTKGAAAWIGNLLPQMVGTGAAIAAGTVNPALGMAVGYANMGMLTGSTMGSSMQQAREAGASNEQVWAAGLADGAIELITEKIPFDVYTKKIFGRAKQQITKEMMSSVVDNPAAKEELQKLVKAANKELGGSLISKARVQDYLGEVLAEGGSELAAGALQTITPIIYQNPEDYPTLTEIIKNGVEGAAAGLFMGAVLGGAGSSIEYNANRNRRKKQGFVRVAEVTMPDSKAPTFAEIVGVDDKNKTYAALIDGVVETIPQASVDKYHDFTFEEFDSAAIDMMQSRAYNEGYNTADAKAAKTRLDEATARVREMYESEEGADEFLSRVRENPAASVELVMEEGGQERAQIVLDYINAQWAYDGMMQRVADNADMATAQSDAEVDKIAHKDGYIQSGVYDGRKVYVKGGNLDMAVVVDAETGEVMTVATEKVTDLTEQVPAKQEKEQRAAKIREQFAANAENKMQQAEVGQPVEKVELPDVPDYFRLDGIQYNVINRNDDGSIDAMADGKRVKLPAGQDYSKILPTDKKGTVLFTELPVTTTVEYFTTRVGDAQARAELIDNNRKAAEKELAKYDKRPNAGTDPDAYASILNEWKASKEVAQAKVDYWAEVARVNEEVQRSDIREAMNEEVAVDVEQTPDEFVAGVLGGIKITPESFKRETGLSNSEQRSLVGYIADKSKGGVSVERAAELIVENYGDELAGLGFNGDVQEVRDIIIDILSNGNPRSFARRGKELRVQAQKEERLQQLESIAAALNFGSADEMALWEETVIPGIIVQYQGFDENEYYTTLANENNNNDYDTTGAGQAAGIGSEILQGEQFIDNGGEQNVGERNQGGEVQHNVQGNGENVAPQADEQVADQSEDNLEMVEPVGISEQLPLQNGNNELTLQQENEQNNVNEINIPRGGQILESVPQGEHGAQTPQIGGMEETAARLGERIEADGGTPQGGLSRNVREIENRVTREYAQENGLWIPFNDVFKLGRPSKSGNEHDTYVDTENRVIYKVNNRMNTPSIVDLLNRMALHNKYFPESKYSLVGFTAISENGDVWPVFAQDYVPGARVATNEEIDAYMGALGFAPVGEGRYSNGEIVAKDLRPRNVLVDADGDVYVVDAEFEPAAAENAVGGSEMPNIQSRDNVSQVEVVAEENKHDVPKSEEEKETIRQRANKWAKKVGVKAHIIESYDDVASEQAREAIKQQRVPGWFSKGEVYIYMLHVVDEIDLDKTYIHEVVGHKGLKTLLGKDFDALCDAVWAMMSSEARNEYLEYVGAVDENGNVLENPAQWQMRAAADEYMAAIAEDVNLDKNKGIWQTIADWFRSWFNHNFADDAKRILNKEMLTDEDIIDLVKLSYANLQQRAESNEQGGSGTMFSKKGENKKSPNSAAPGKPVNTTAKLDELFAKIDKLKQTYNSRTSKKTRGFITDIARELGLTKDGPSHYRTFPTALGEVTLRVSNHNSSLKEFELRNEDEGVSIIISAKKNKKIDRTDSTGKSHVDEFFYPKQSLERSQGRPLVQILESIEEFLTTGVYVDKTGIAQPEDSNGIRFKKDDATLIGTHSLTEEKLRKAIKMGGLANPSTAIFEMGEEMPGDYGEITFVMPSSMVDKKTGKNTGAFAGDAWTPTYPQVERQMGKRGAARAYEDVRSVPKEMQKEVKMGLDSWLDGRDGADLAYMFLQEEGLAPELSRVAQKYSDEVRDRVSEIAQGEPFYRLSPEQKQKIVDLYIAQYYNGDRAYYEGYLKEKIDNLQAKIAEGNVPSLIKKRVLEDIAAINEYGYNYEAVSDFLNKVQRDINHSGGVNDMATTQEAARIIRENGLEKEFQKWKEDLIDRYEIKEVIFKGFTPTGNRKYVPHTLENVSKDMKEQGRNGAVGLNATFNKFAAGLLKPLGSLDAIRKHKGNLKTTHAETEAFRDKWSEVYYNLAEKLQPNAKGYEDYGLDRVAEAAKKKDPKAFIKSEYGIELSEADEKALKDMVWAIQNEYPVMYFETKFERPVYLDEFAGVAVPENVGEDIVEALNNAGVKIETYEPGNEKARMDAVKRLSEDDDIRFRKDSERRKELELREAKIKMSERQRAKAEEVLKALEEAGHKDLHISSSITDWGVSTYIQGDYGTLLRDMKLRISDHSTTSVARMGEYNYSYDTPVSDIVEYVNKVRAVKEAQQILFDNERAKAKERIAMLEEKWERIKHFFDGLRFYKTPRTYKHFDEFASDKSKSNILQTDLGDGAFAYEYSAPQNGYGVKKPSFDYIDAFNEEQAEVETTRLRMGSRVDARMAEVASHFDGKELSPEKRAVVDVFGGKADNLTINVKTKDGNEKKIVMRQGNEMGAGAKHSLFRHYGMNNGAITADDILLIPEIVANGERTESGKKIVYKYSIDSVEYTVITENNKGREEFANFYTNRKASPSARKTRSEEARASNGNASEDKGSDNSLNTQEDGTRLRKVREELEFNDEENKSLTLKDKILQGMFEASAKNKEDFALRMSALNSFAKELARALKSVRLQRIVSAQKKYDRSTVDTLVKLAKMYFKNAQLLGEVSANDVSLVLGALNRAVGKDDISNEASRLVEILVDAHTRELKALLDKAEKVKASKINASGVEVQGTLDKYGQITINMYKDAASWEQKDLEQEIAKIENDIAESEGEKQKELTAELEGLSLAFAYKSVVEAENDVKNLKREMRNGEAEMRANGADSKAVNEYKQATFDSIVEGKLDVAMAYQDLIRRFSQGVSKSSTRAKAFAQQQIDHVREIQHNANSDMEGISASAQGEKPKAWNNPIIRGMLSPMLTLQGFFKKFGEKAVDGKGYLYNRFMPMFTKANDQEYKGKVAARAKIAAKLQEIYGKQMSMNDLLDEASKPGVTISYSEGGKILNAELTQGQMMYIYMVNKMADGEMKLRRMNITDDVVEGIKAKIDDRLVQLADWVQDELLSNLRVKYNAVYEKMFGAPMAQIEQYFPIKIRKEAIGEKTDVGQPDMESKPSTITGSIIKRTKNAAAVDLSADATMVLLEHIDNMEHWAAFAEFNRDINTLLNYRHFQNQVKNMSTVRYGSGIELWKNFSDAVLVAVGTYRTKEGALDKAVMNFAKGVTRSKIAFRLYTAIKQILSAPAFWSEAGFDELKYSYTHPQETWEWAKKELPGFAERWEGRRAGSEKLLDRETDWKLWHSRFVENVSYYGMTPNAAVDAMTVALGSRAVYLTKYKIYKEAGYSEQRAKEKALQAAAESYNETQQSSLGAYMSPVQQSSSATAAIFTTFMNSNFAYNRKFAQAIANLTRRIKGGKSKMIEFRAKELVRDGLGAEEAKRLATKEYNKSILRDSADVALFGFGLQLLWEFGGMLIYLLGGDDEEEKKELLTEAMVRALASPINAVPFGQLATNAATAAILDDWKKMRIPQLVAVSDMQNIANLMEYDAVRGATELLNMFVAAGVGVDPKTFTDVYAAVADVEDLSPEELGLFALRIINAPQSQLEKLTVDKAIAESGKEMLDITRRYVEYRKKKMTPITQFLYTEEEEAKAEKRSVNRFNKMVEERMENLVEEDTAFKLYYNAAPDNVKGKLSKMREKYFAVKNGESKANFEKADAVDAAAEILFNGNPYNTIYFDNATPDDIDNQSIIKMEWVKYKKYNDEFRKLKDADKKVFIEKYRQELQRYKRLDEFWSAISKGMRNMEKNPSKAKEIMQRVRLLNANAIKYINSYE